MWADNPPIVTTFTIDTHDWRQRPCHTQWIWIDWNRKIPSERESQNPHETTYIAKFGVWLGRKGRRMRWILKITYIMVYINLALSAYGCPEAQPRTGKIWTLLINAWSNVRPKFWRKRSLIRGAYGQNSHVLGFWDQGFDVNFQVLGQQMMRRRRGKWMRCCWGVHAWQFKFIGVIISLNRCECLWNIFVSSSPFQMKIEPSPHGMVYWWSVWHNFHAYMHPIYLLIEVLVLCLSTRLSILWDRKKKIIQGFKLHT